MNITIGKCGLACGLCKHYNLRCLGCEKENLAKHVCLIFNCAEEKNVKYCLDCEEYPCRLMKGLSKSYCPVFTSIKFD
jgi:hypothetical protein